MQMIYKFVVLFVVCLIAIKLSNGLTQKELCPNDTNNKNFANFRVEAAFKISEKLIGIVGKLEDNSSVALRVKFWYEPDPSGKSPDKYYEAKIWGDVQQIDKEKNIRLAFSARGVNTDGQLFPSKKYDIVFIVQNENLTTALQFETNNVETMKDESTKTYDKSSDKRVVYDPSDPYDDSGYIGIKYLYIHFPHPLKILAIMVFDRQKKVTRQSLGNVPHNMDRMGYVTHPDPFHHAIVYTEEVGSDGKTYYFRHYMRSEIQKYYDEKHILYKSLDWFFDSNVDFCDSIQLLNGSPITAVTLYRNDEEKRQVIKEKRNQEDSSQIFHFIEFYGKKHKRMKVVFHSLFSDNYTVEEADGKEVDNAVAFSHCEPHPIDKKQELIPCADYLEESGVGGRQSVSNQSSNSDQKYLWFAVIITFVLILVLLAFCVMSVLKK